MGPEEVQGAGGAGSWLSLELCLPTATPGLILGGQLGDIPGGDGGRRHKPTAGGGRMPGGTVRRNPEAPG